MQALQHLAVRLSQRRQLLPPAFLQETGGSLMPGDRLAQRSAV